MLLWIAKFHSSLWLCSVHVCVCVCVCVSHLLNTFICWWTLICFHTLAVVNSATENIVVHVSFHVSVFIYFQIYIQELLGHMVVLFLVVFRKSPYCFPWWLHQFTFPPTMYKVLFSPHPHQYLLLVFFLMIAILKYEMISSCLSLQFSDD